MRFALQGIPKDKRPTIEAAIKATKRVTVVFYGNGDGKISGGIELHEFDSRNPQEYTGLLPTFGKAIRDVMGASADIELDIADLDIRWRISSSKALTGEQSNVDPSSR